MNRTMGETSLSVHARLWLIASLAVVIVPHLLRLPLALVGFCLGAIGWRLLKDLRGWQLPGKPASLLLTVAGLGAVIGLYGTVFGHEAGAALLVVMLCLKLIEVRTLRDGMVVVMLGYFVVVSGFLFDQSMFAGAYLFAVAGLLTGSLIALNHPGGGPGQWRRYLRLSGALLLQALPLMLALFVLFPRISGSLWGLAGPEQTGRTGLGDRMEMGSVSRLVDSEEVALRAEFPDGVPAAERLYWRGPILWHTDGQSWTRLSEAQSEELQPLPYEPTGSPLAYRVTIEPHQRRWLLALDYPGAPRSGRKLTPGWQLLANDEVETRRRLQLRAFPAIAGAPLDERLRDWALALPAGRNPRSLALARRWRAEATEDRALMERALAYFREGPFIYTREPPPLGADAVDQFLFESRRGYCEHFAASFTTLMRAAGVPARVVTGYQGGEQNPVGNFLVVRQSDAHAWSEVYLRGQGWVRVDPTAVIPPGRVEAVVDRTRFETVTGREGVEGHWWRQGWQLARQGWEALNHGWNLWVLGYGAGQQQRLLEALGLAAAGWGALVGLLALLLAAGLSLVGVLILRRGRQHQDPLARHWQRFCAKLARVGVVYQRHEGPLDFGRRAARLRPRDRHDIRRIVGLYEALRYGRPRRQAGKQADLERAIRRFRPHR